MNVDGDTQIQNPENSPAHVDVDEEHNLAEIIDLVEAEDILNIQNVSTVTVQITMNVIVRRTSSVIDKIVVPTSVDEKKSMLKDRQLGLRHRTKQHVKLIRPKENFHRQQGTKQLKNSIIPNSEMLSPLVRNGLLNCRKCQPMFIRKDPLTEQ